MNQAGLWFFFFSETFLFSALLSARYYIAGFHQPTEVNQALAQSPELVNSDPYGGAWMVKLKLGNPSEVEVLMDSVAYQKNTEERSR